MPNSIILYRLKGGTPRLSLYSHSLYFARFSVCLCARWVMSPHRLDLFSTAPTPAVRNLLLS